MDAETVRVRAQADLREVMRALAAGTLHSTGMQRGGDSELIEVADDGAPHVLHAPRVVWRPRTTVVRLRRAQGVVVQDCDVYIGRACQQGGWAPSHHPSRRGATA